MSTRTGCPMMTSKLSSSTRAGLTADISRGAVRHFVFSAETVQRGAGVSETLVESRS